MTTATARPPTVLCVDDNPLIADALRRTFARAGGWSWLGWLPEAGGLLEAARADPPAVVILDLDMPGADPFEVLARMTAEFPGTRTVVFTGHVRCDLVDRAVAAGAWGYVSKNDGEGALTGAVAAVLRGEFAISPEVRMAIGF